MSIRSIAKKDEWLTIYNLSKETHLSLFKNVGDYTDGQITFLRYLNFYSSLQRDILLNEVDELVLKDELYEDSYMMWKNLPKKETPTRSHTDNNSNQITTNTQWIFKNSKKVK